MKYLVMECRPGYAVVLDEDGRFLRVANRRYAVGQTVTGVIEMEAPQAVSRQRKRSRWVYAAATMAACLLLVAVSLLRFERMTYASVYMTINPSVRIDVNRRDRVIGAEGVNDDGRALLEGYSFQKKDLVIVMDELVERAVDMGYLHEGGRISLSLDAGDSGWIVSRGDALLANLNERLKGELSVTIEIAGMDSNGSKAVIPVNPGESNGGSDYGESDYGDSGYGAVPGQGDDGDSDYDGRGSQSNYDDSNYPAGSGGSGSSDSDYGTGAASGASGQSDDDDSDYGESGSTPQPAEGDDGDDDGQTDYDDRDTDAETDDDDDDDVDAD